jgi:hypothetical protein
MADEKAMEISKGGIAGTERKTDAELSGVPYDPTAQAGPDLTQSAEEREPGGLGIFMTKKLMDMVEYMREGNKNILTLKKGVL